MDVRISTKVVNDVCYQTKRRSTAIIIVTHVSLPNREQRTSPRDNALATMRGIPSVSPTLFLR